MTEPGSRFFVVLLLLTIPASQIAVDVYTPSMPSMVQALHTSENVIQNSLTVFLIASGISMFLWGIVSDTIGRRAVYLWGTVIFVMGTLMCIAAPNAPVFLLGRVVQGLGAGCIVCLPAMMADVFSGKQLAHLSSYNSIVWSSVPIIAPFIGGILQQHFNWRANFAFILLYGVITLLLIWRYLPETLPTPKRHPLHLKKITQGLVTIGREPCFIGYTLIIFLSWSVMMLFSIITPFLFQEVLHLSPAYYGFLALLFGVGYMLGAAFNQRLLKRFRIEILILTGIIGLCAGALIVIITGYLGLVSTWWVMGPCIVTVFLTGMLYPNGWAMAVDSFPKQYVGIGSALLDIIVMAGVSMVTFIGSHLHIHSQTPMGWSFLAFGLLSALCLLFVRFQTHRRSNR